MARAFAAAGDRVHICDIDAGAVERVTGESAAITGTLCDVSDRTSVESFVRVAADTLGGIDVLINNASGYGFEDKEDDWAAGFNVDMMAPVRASHAALPYLSKSAHASILHTSSIAGLHPRPNTPPYGAMKAALCHYTTSQALALASQRIRVNAIAPGSIEFEGGLWDHVKHDDPARYATVLSKIPFGRYGTPEEVAHAALFLASPWASWITGQILCVDGGQQLSR
jgi:3-oxoacyl-[acyl-carrier protein] reductase